MTKINTNKAVKFGSTSQACSACKYQRRKCAPNCLLAPFFPPDRQQDFLNAHKLFGVSNISKTIRDLRPLEKQMAISSIIFQANARARDPVGGCQRIIIELRRLMYSYQKELDCVRKQLAYYKSLGDSIKNNNDTLLVGKNDNNMGGSFVVQSIVNDQPSSHAGEKSFNIYDKEPQELTNIADQEKLANQEKSKIKQKKLEVKELSSSPSAEEQSCTVQLCNLADISEDVKPFLGGFDERDNTIFFDSNKVVLKDEERKGHGLRNVTSQFSLNNVKEYEVQMTVKNI